MSIVRRLSFSINIFIFLASVLAIQVEAMGFGDIPKFETISKQTLSLSNRNANPFVNGIFKDNILLNVAYISGKVINPSQINWSELQKPFIYEFTLKPGEAFAFHDDVLPEFTGKVVKTGNSHFNYRDGYKTDGFLYGDGVCHLASLMYWAAKDARLLAKAPIRHNIAPIPDVAYENGVSIYYAPGASQTNKLQNMYIQNIYKKPVVIRFNYKNNTLSVSILKAA
ncbi:MAG: VanW family protein [Candidatus Levybacteria bacterium]|nr:VanW family protein [Candidatus Levybacteria bacterium]